MELAYVTVIGAMLGTIARYVMPGRGSYGILLLPAVAAAATSAVWVVLVWLGWTFDGGWIWVVSLAAAVVASIVVALGIVRRRDTTDTQLLQRLSAGKA